MKVQKAQEKVITELQTPYEERKIFILTSSYGLNWCKKYPTVTTIVLLPPQQTSAPHITSKEYSWAE